MEKSGKRAKLEERTEERRIASLQDTSPYSLLELIPDVNNYTPEIASATPPPVLTSRPETDTRRDPTLKEKTEPQPYQETEKKVATNSLPQSSGRGLCNIGNTCFLNIQCLGAIDEVHQAALSTQVTTTTQDELLRCIRKLQQPGTAYTPASLIKRIPHLIRHTSGDSADAHELLIALINDVSEPLAQIFQGQMSSTVQCSQCNKLTTTTDNMQDISLHINTDSSSPHLEGL